MRILLAASLKEFGSEQESCLQRVLEDELRKKGHSVDSFALPYVAEEISMPLQTFAIRNMDVSDCDVLITIGFPALVLQHTNKYSFLFDTAPRLMEYFGTKYGMADNTQYHNIARICRHILGEELSAAKKVYCASELLRQDIEREFGIIGKTILQMNRNLDYEKTKADGEKGCFLLAETIFDVYERNEQLIDVLPFMSPARELILYASNDDEQFIRALYERAERLGVRKRLEIRKGHPSVQMILQASGIVSIPYQVRRIPRLAVAAAMLGTPIVTADDSGALLEIVRKKEAGTIVSPARPDELARAIDFMIEKGERSRSGKDIEEEQNWEQIIEEMVRQ